MVASDQRFEPFNRAAPKGERGSGQRRDLTRGGGCWVYSCDDVNSARPLTTIVAFGDPLQWVIIGALAVVVLGVIFNVLLRVLGTLSRVDRYVDSKTKGSGQPAQASGDRDSHARDILESRRNSPQPQLG